jgi:hypothetical protein
MKNKIKVSLIFTVGLVVGALLSLIILGQFNYLRYADFFVVSAREQVFIASELRANRGRELQHRAEANLPTLVLSIQKNRKLQSASGTQSVLRSVRDFYEINSLPIPTEISEILRNVPRAQLTVN